LHDLYEELIAPLRSQLGGRHLIVVSHELLHYVPFHALFDGEQYLGDAFTISHAPSASIYIQCHEKQADCVGPSLVLGVPDASTPAIHEELESVAKMVPEAEVFLGSDASSNVLRQRGSRSRLIHIAAHGFFRQDNPMFSGIRLGDTFLTLHDLYGLKLAADQVTLSGCSTGLSVVAGGDELIGLMRGLLAAGARTLLLTLWDVHDRSTAEFMKEFYSRMYDGRDRSAALREAMQEIRKSYPHPYYWAPFILVGKTFHSS
jgi:CHAT domain-containing protein